VALRIGTLPPKPKAEAAPQYLREHAAAKYLGVSVSALRSWRNRGTPSGSSISRSAYNAPYRPICNH
jgi:hypothetical protein